MKKNEPRFEDLNEYIETKRKAPMHQFDRTISLYRTQ